MSRGTKLQEMEVKTQQSKTVVNFGMGSAGAALALTAVLDCCVFTSISCNLVPRDIFNSPI